MRSYLIFALGLLLSLSACQSNRIEVAPEDLLGVWVRESSDKPEYNGMEITVVLDSQSNQAQGYVSYNYYPDFFPLGTHKWRNIRPQRGMTFALEDLGSGPTANSYPATIELDKAQGIMLLRVTAPYQTYGQEQAWRKRN